MRLWCGLAFAAALLAQQPAPLGIVRGDLVELDSDAAGFSLRLADGKTYRFNLNQRTYIERDRKRIPISALRKGDKVDVLSDLGSSPGVRYARIVHVLDPNAPPLERLKRYRSPLEDMFPRGELTFSGVVLEVTPDTVLLRTRTEGEKLIMLRSDTRYLDGGNAVDASAIRAQMRVFMRAGKTLDGEIEAYQVIWGAILAPQSPR